jgi:2-oxoglutarate ferredoxin oxidoreductase subunit beta
MNNKLPLHDIGYVPVAEEIVIDSYDPGELKVVELHDGSHIRLRKTEADFDPTNRAAAMERLQRANDNKEFITGLIYYDASRPSLAEVSNVVDTPLAWLPDEKLRPSKDALDSFMQSQM